jgi:3-dehydro-L-gulonate 2-dehydrogenase
VRGERLPVDGGFDQAGQLTRDPGAIEASNRPLPIGYWKGSGLSVMLDMLGALLSGGLATHQIKVNVIEETRLTQVFLAFDLPTIDQAQAREDVIEGIIGSLRRPGAHTTATADSGSVRYPGEKILLTRAQNLAEGIPVEPRIWHLVQEM